jgi:DNA-binding NtrC family response regulator
MKTKLDGLSLLELVRQNYEGTPVVLMTAFGSIETAIRAVKEGAYDYISKPFNIDELVATGHSAIGRRSLHQSGRRRSHERIGGPYPAYARSHKMIARSESSASVLVTGNWNWQRVGSTPSTHSPRAKAIVAINCGASPKHY